MPFATTRMQPEIITLSEVSQKEKDKYRIISLICGIQNMTQMNLSMKQKHKEKRLVVAMGRGLAEECSRRLGLADISFYLNR